MKKGNEIEIKEKNEKKEKEINMTKLTWKMNMEDDKKHEE